MTVTDTETFGSEWIAKERLEQLRKEKNVLSYRMYLDEEHGEVVLTYVWVKQV